MHSDINICVASISRRSTELDVEQYDVISALLYFTYVQQRFESFQR